MEDKWRGKRSEQQKKLWRNTTHKNDLGTWKWMILCFVRNNICVVRKKKTGLRWSGTTTAVSTSKTEIERAQNTSQSTHTADE